MFIHGIDLTLSVKLKLMHIIVCIHKRFYPFFEVFVIKFLQNAQTLV